MAGAAGALVSAPIIRPGRVSTNSALPTTVSRMERLSLGARFRGAVELHGCSTAAVEGGTKLDYTAVADRVQGFVDAYARAGLGREDTVAVAAVGSAAAWQAIVGAAVAGLTWIPVDARQPEPILRHILRNSGAGLCVGFALETESAAGAHCEYLDGTTVASTSWRGACARGHASSSDIAYVIYTSGSTGLPKGVLISEDALSGFLDWTAAHEGLARDDRILQNHSIGFDNSIWEMFSGLSAGGAVVFPTADERRDFELLLRLIERARVTVLNATPRQMTTLLRAGDLLGRQGSFATVRRLYTGAETVTHAAAELILRALPPTAYVANEYGPTEATITCTLGPITHKVLEASASEPSVPIGWAIGDATIEVRSGDRRCVELGDIGELWVGGRCVSLGYRGLPEETTERFAVDDDGTRWYRTATSSGPRRTGTSSWAAPTAR